MANYKTPGVYIEEIPGFPQSIAQVETAIPVFIGYTEKAQLKRDDDLRNVPHRINSAMDYLNFYGGADLEKRITVNVNTNKKRTEIDAKIERRSSYLMYYSLMSFYENGGGSCYIISVGGYSNRGTISQKALLIGLKMAGNVADITLIVYPDGINMKLASDYYSVVNQSLYQCKTLKDRFMVCDVCIQNDPAINDIAFFRENLVNTTDGLKHGAAYYPYLEMQFDYHYNAKDVKVNKDGANMSLDTLEVSNNPLFKLIEKHIKNIPFMLPPSAAIVGIYNQVDRSRGVWKAPANVNIDLAIKPTIKINNYDQEKLNVDELAGISINAIRSFTGKGSAVVWGARTLAGNDNEWRYIPVRRFSNMVNASVKKGTLQFVFEPNDSNTWVRIKAIILNFLYKLWKAGALAGSTPQYAYYVKVGLNETMTAQDILEGSLHIEIGMAVIRPAEFIILKFSHKMQTE